MDRESDEFEVDHPSSGPKFVPNIRELGSELGAHRLRVVSPWPGPADTGLFEAALPLSVVITPRIPAPPAARRIFAELRARAATEVKRQNI